MLRNVTATRYATPLREGGSLPGLMEADDLGTWVVKFHGAGQGVKALLAEVVAGELARALGFAVPELVVIDVDPELGRVEPDQEIQELLRASPGANLGMDYLPGSITYDPLAFTVDAGLAARVLWLDALVLNVDRSWRNPNLLLWGGRLWLIDHGAALYPHHDWTRAKGTLDRALPQWNQHVLLPAAGELAVSLPAADAALAPAVTEELLRDVLALVPDAWFGIDANADADAARYVDWLHTRVSGSRPWVTAMLATDRPTRSADRGTGPPEWLRRRLPSRPAHAPTTSPPAPGRHRDGDHGSNGCEDGRRSADDRATDNTAGDGRTADGRAGDDRAGDSRG
ncbi:MULTISPECIES: HipA family kinase [Protofrankia]|uniref:HipA family kinase n=1 Tax=Protofrankia TaxID=2994361 RepID=UPI003083EF77